MGVSIRVAERDIERDRLTDTHLPLTTGSEWGLLTTCNFQAEYTKALEAYHSSPAYQQYLAAKNKGRC